MKTSSAPFQGANDKRLDEALTDQSLVQVKITGYGGAVLAVVTAIGVWGSFPDKQVVIWVFACIALSLPRSFVFNWVEVERQTFDKYCIYEACILGVLFASGAVWGTAGWLFLDFQNPKIFALVLTTGLGVVSATLASLSVRPLHWFVLAAPVFALSILKLAISGAREFVAMGLIYMGVLTMVSRRLSERIKHSISQDFRNAEILVEVSKAKEAAENHPIQWCADCAV